MSKRVLLVLLSVALLAATAGPAAAQNPEGDWTFSLDSTFASQYLWRGFVLNSTPSLQPGVTIGYKGLSVSSWSNFSQRTPTGQSWTEHDLTVNYSHSIGKVGLSGGYIWYHFPDLTDDAAHTHEFYAGISIDTWLAPSFTYYRDVDDGDGDYLYFGLSHSQPLGKAATLKLGTGAGLNNGQWIDNTVISNWDINVSVDIPWGKVVFAPFFTQMIGHHGRVDRAQPLFGNHNAFGVAMNVASLGW